MTPDFDDLDHERFMREALKEAELALQQGEKPIGAVIVHNGKVIGRGRAQHQKRKSKIAHAELNALIQAEQYIRAHNHECVVYTTVEACVMCLGAIVMSNIDHIVFALPDRRINPSKMLEIDYVQQHIKHYIGGVLETESVTLWEKADPCKLRMLLDGKL